MSFHNCGHIGSNGMGTANCLRAKVDTRLEAMPMSGLQHETGDMGIRDTPNAYFGDERHTLVRQKLKILFLQTLNNRDGRSVNLHAAWPKVGK